MASIAWIGHTDMSEFRTTLEQMASTDDPAERKRLAGLLASQLEVRENNQSNRTQVALWDVQESADRKLDRLHAQLNDHTLLVTETGAAITAKVDSYQEEQRAAWEETRETLGKHDQILAEHTGAISDLGEDLSQTKGTVAEHAAHIAAFRSELDGVKVEVVDLTGRVAVMEKTLADLISETGATGADTDAIKRLRTQRGA